MALLNRLRIFLTVTLISPMAIVNFVHADQPFAQDAGGRSPTAWPAAVSVLDVPQIVNPPQAIASDSMANDHEPNPSLEGSAIVLQRSANGGRVNRQVIRSMDILDRPFRLGHFYGNAVRRRN